MVLKRRQFYFCDSVHFSRWVLGVCCTREGAAINTACALSQSDGNLQYCCFSRKSNQVITGNQGETNMGTLSKGKRPPFELLVMSLRLHLGSGLGLCCLSAAQPSWSSASSDEHLRHSPCKIRNPKLYSFLKLSHCLLKSYLDRNVLCHFYLCSA